MKIFYYLVIKYVHGNMSMEKKPTVIQDSDENILPKMFISTILFDN